MSFHTLVPAACEFHAVLDAAVCLRPTVANITDVYRRFDVIVKALKNSRRAAERFLGDRLGVVKMHANLLRHDHTQIQQSHVIRTITFLNDIALCLDEISQYTEGCQPLIAAVHHFAWSYYEAGVAAGFVMPYLDELFAGEVTELQPQQPPPATEPKAVQPAALPPGLVPPHPGPEPPKKMPMRWYKMHGWYDFFVGRTVMFEKGHYAMTPAVVMNFNSNNTRCRFPDGTYHHIHVDIPVTWE